MGLGSMVDLFARIQPTYEELKRYLPLQRSDLRFGIQPTYEELKRDGEGGAEVQCVGIQPTYEELKHIITLVAKDTIDEYPAYL